MLRTFSNCLISSADWIVLVTGTAELQRGQHEPGVVNITVGLSIIFFFKTLIILSPGLLRSKVGRGT